MHLSSLEWRLTWRGTSEGWEHSWDDLMMSCPNLCVWSDPCGKMCWPFVEMHSIELRNECIILENCSFCHTVDQFQKSKGGFWRSVILCHKVDFKSALKSSIILKCNLCFFITLSLLVLLSCVQNAPMAAVLNCNHQESVSHRVCLFVMCVIDSWRGPHIGWATACLHALGTYLTIP